MYLSSFSSYSNSILAFIYRDQLCLIESRVLSRIGAWISFSIVISVLVDALQWEGIIAPSFGGGKHYLQAFMVLSFLDEISLRVNKFLFTKLYLSGQSGEGESCFTGILMGEAVILDVLSKLFLVDGIQSLGWNNYFFYIAGLLCL